LGLEEQPTSEHFENVLAGELMQLDYSRPIWVEDESRHIGQVFMNATFYDQLRTARVLFLDIEAQYRLPHLVDVYAHYPKEELARAIDKIKKRLGGDHAKDAHEALEMDNFSEVAAITLHYYDKAYVHGLEIRATEKIHRLVIATCDPHLQTDAVMAHPLFLENL
jgi:tRNA 2-selenouridine synthase